MAIKIKSTLLQQILLFLFTDPHYIEQKSNSFFLMTLEKKKKCGALPRSVAALILVLHRRLVVRVSLWCAAHKLAAGYKLHELIAVGRIALEFDRLVRFHRHWSLGLRRHFVQSD